MEYAGAVEVHPPFRAEERAWLEELPWRVSSDGTCLRPESGSDVDRCLAGLRHLVDLDGQERTYDGAVAAFAPDTFELVLLSVRARRVTRRTLRKGRMVRRDNVIDLAARRRAISRHIS
ncbi:MAG TPA: hypothetical protein VFJ89_09035 [Nocardioides sp.]|jgi:hypothetical protein|nr:hypothetical protein [Nocardioides sp.]